MTIKFQTAQEIPVVPVDFDSIAKGDSLSPAQLVEITGKRIGTTAYQLAVLQLVNRIQRECSDRGKHFSVAVIKGSVCILTDEQAAEYEHRQFKSKFRSAGRSHGRALHVNVNALSEAQRKQHERNILVQGAMLQSAHSTRRRLIAQSHKRSVPGLPQNGNGTSESKQTSE